MIYKMHGCIPPMVTPFDKNGNVDEVELRKLVRFLNDKVHGIFICGSYGCGPLMSIEERKHVAEIAREEGTNLQIIAMTGCANTRDTIELTKHAKSIGLDAASAVAPFYYHHNMNDVVGFYSDVMKSVGDYPVYIYTNPKFAGYAVDVNTLKRLYEVGVHGVKAASFDIMEFANIVRAFQGTTFDIALGTEALWLPAAAYGSDAFIPGLANAFPEICVQMYDEAKRCEWEKCRDTQFKVNELRDVMYLASSTQMAIYAMINLREIANCYPRKPFSPATSEEIANIKDKLISMNMLH